MEATRLKWIASHEPSPSLCEFSSKSPLVPASRLASGAGASALSGRPSEARAGAIDRRRADDRQNQVRVAALVAERRQERKGCRQVNHRQQSHDIFHEMELSNSDSIPDLICFPLTEGDTRI